MFEGLRESNPEVYVLLKVLRCLVILPLSFFMKLNINESTLFLSSNKSVVKSIC